MTERPLRIIDPRRVPVWQDSERAQRLARLISDQTCDARTLFAGMYWLAPGRQTIVDVHPTNEEVYYVVQGKGQLILDGVEAPIEQGMAVHIPAGVKHQSINTGDVDLCYFYVYAPPPAQRDLASLGWTLREGEATS